MLPISTCRMFHPFLRHSGHRKRLQAILRALEDLARIFNPNSPIPDTDLPELVIDKQKEKKKKKEKKMALGRLSL